MRLKFKCSIIIVINNKILVYLHIILSLKCTEVIFEDYSKTSEHYHLKKGAKMKQKGPNLS